MMLMGEMMLLILKLLLYALSTLGLWEMVHRRFSTIDISFIPGITVAFQTTLLFFAGLFNVLSETTFIIFGFGFVCFVLFIYGDRSVKFIRTYINPSILFLGIALLIMGFSLKGKIFTHYDNFSHWALVVRRIIETNRFPNYSDKIIRFQEYPIGSAIYIYYVTKLTNNAESIQMLAQVYMMLVSIIPLFALSKKGWPLIALIIASFTNYVLTYNTSVTDLLVDTLLPLVSMSGLLYALLYGKNTDNKWDVVPMAFFLTQIIQIKNSGLFFAAFISLIMVIYALKENNKGIRFASVIMPLSTFYLWHKHCQYAFGSSEVSKHAMTIENYSNNIAKKTTEDIKLILKTLYKFAINWNDIWLTMGVLIIAITLVVLLYRKGNRKAITIGIIAVLLFGAYQIGLIGMYIFSMPVGEAVELAGIKRYEKTIIIAVLYLSLIPVIGLISRNYTQSKLKTITATVLLVSAVFVHMGISGGMITFAPLAVENRSPKERIWVETVKQEYSIQDGESYTMLVPPKSLPRYAKYLCKYIFQSNSTEGLIVTSEQDLDSINSKYILVYDKKNEIVKSWVRDHFPDQEGESVIITK